MAESLASGLRGLSVTQDRSRTPSQASSSPRCQAVELAGIDDVLDALREVVDWPIRYRAEAAHLGVTFPTGVLLHGPPGVGKTAAVAQVARETGAAVHRVDPGDVIGSFLGESERRLRDIFAAARAAAAADPSRPVIVLLDEADALCGRRSPQRPHEARVVGQLLTLMDGAERHDLGGGHMVVVGTTSSPDSLDPALRRPGRFDTEIPVPVPDGPARVHILRALAAGLGAAAGLDLDELALGCFGYSGADLAALCREAALSALGRVAGGAGEGSGMEPGPRSPRQGAGSPGPREEDVVVTMEDFESARSKVVPSITRGLTLDFVPVAWDQIGGLPDIKRRLRQAVEWPLQRAPAFQRLGLVPPRGVLLHGPPGCSKTTLARAVATSSRATFVSLSVSQLFSQYVGEGEAILRRAFQRARLAAPAILFLDEVDVLVGRRSEGEQTQDATARLLSTFLTEMDGLEAARGVLVLGATNRPSAIDAAMLRPGRFDVVLYVPPPDLEGREAVLRIHSRGMPLAPGVDLRALAARTQRYTGAELAQVCREAALAAVREDGPERWVGPAHFEAALEEVAPALSQHDLDRAAAWRRRPAPTPLPSRAPGPRNEPTATAP